MAKPGFIVSFAGAGAPEISSHRVRNFAEELQGELERQAWGTVVNPDTATNMVEVTGATTRSIGNVAAAINRSLRRLGLVEHATVMRRRSAGDVTRKWKLKEARP